jgi:hypothetical protein
MNETETAIAERAIEKLQHSWWKAGEPVAQGSYCAATALWAAELELYRRTAVPHARAVLQHLGDAAKALFPERAHGYGCSEPAHHLHNPAVHVNDHPDTTLEDVLLIYKHALANTSPAGGKE